MSELMSELLWVLLIGWAIYQVGWILFEWRKDNDDNTNP
jgi:hypothetical protein